MKGNASRRRKKETCAAFSQYTVYIGAGVCPAPRFAIEPMIPSAENNANAPFVQTLARRQRAVSPDVPFATVCELLRVSPYGTVAVVDAPGSHSALLTGRLVGIVTAQSITDRLLSASGAEQKTLRGRGTAGDVCAPVSPDNCAVPTDDRADVLVRFDRAGRDALPVVESRDAPYYLGMVSRSDLLYDLHRPFVPSQIGGMATPLGVYLTNGTVSGGVGAVALAATGLLTFTLHTLGLGAIIAASYAAARYFPGATQLYNTLPEPLTQTVQIVAQMTLFLALLRATPLAGYHAAEHQVVHALERGEPLLPDVVTTMPRVHPRCSTNLVAGVMIFYILGTALSGVLPEGASYLFGGLAAFFGWRSFGAFLQANATTRPATPRQIESGIRAARALQTQMDTRISGDIAMPNRFSPLRARFRQVWQAGFLQIFIGSAFGILLIFLLALIFPVVRRIFE
ncbi:MAG: DUF1385 domain-containing protein [Armatimonadetes bacterium]|nr:DUF1385 domain-containing protein [Armatimonadota bacterium]